MRLEYSVVLNREDEGGYSVSFPDFPEAFTQGEREEEALSAAIDCLEEAIANRIALKMDIPVPSASTGHFVVPVTPRAAFAAAVYMGMKEHHLTRVQVAAQVGVDEKQIRRLLDPYHNSRLKATESVLSAVGKRVVVSIEDLEPDPCLV